jgi:hypothetical protein
VNEEHAPTHVQSKTDIANRTAPVKQVFCMKQSLEMQAATWAARQDGKGAVTTTTPIYNEYRQKILLILTEYRELSQKMVCSDCGNGRFGPTRQSES